MDLTAVEGKQQETSNGGWMVTAMFLGLGKRHDYRDALRTIEAPALVLYGEIDLQPVPVGEGYASLLPNARVRVIKDAGHFIFTDRPTDFAKVVKTFLQGFCRD